MKKLIIYKLFGVISGIASTLIMIRNFYILTFVGRYTVTPDPLNGIELIMAMLALPVFFILFVEFFGELVHGD